MRNVQQVAGDLRHHLEHVWSAETSAYDAWRPDQPSRGQCAVTAAIVQDIFGGDILRSRLVDVVGAHSPIGQALTRT